MIKASILLTGLTQLKRFFIATSCSALIVSCSSDNNGLDLNPDHSVARYWNDATLKAIRSDFARPTVHARNLFHTSIAMYDAWAAYDDTHQTYLLGKSLNGVNCEKPVIQTPRNIEQARNKTISYAAYSILRHRFKDSPGADESLDYFNRLMRELGYNTSPDDDDSAALLGRSLARCVINYGLEDGANEENHYAIQSYAPVNPALNPEIPGNSSLSDFNRWQPLAFNDFVDQSNNALGAITTEFVGPEWGHVRPFALNESQRSVFQRNGFSYPVYNDPGAPPYLNTVISDTDSEQYRWNFSVVVSWAAQLDPADGVMWDISPAAMGNNNLLPQSRVDYPTFYDRDNGGDWSTGHPVNPVTGQAYQSQMVPRADFARVIAEFWADGPDSETPPGHWYVLLNDVSDHPALVKRFEGQGEILDTLEWDVKAYFSLGGAMHDAAISAWSIKGWYDYIRPISAIRGMARLGQSSSPTDPSYHPGGLPLIPGLIELVLPGDPLAGINNLNAYKIKIYSWRGPGSVNNPDTDTAGVGWILADRWWPYQRPSFVTPPFAGYVSGHSTFSRAAAEVLSLFTGSEFFPGGLGEYHIEKNNFLVFESGPSVDMSLQWATYRDASDQSSLSRIWGGIHPPADDIPGRLIGEQVGIDAFNYAKTYFSQ